MGAKPSKPSIWLTYAWVDNEEGNFSYLVQELETVGVLAKYDKIQLIRGQRLWPQIAKEIMEGPYDGWGYLLTKNGIESEACCEELAYALYRALSDKERGFPLIGLLHGVRINDVPNELKIRLCVNLANADWREEVKSALERRAPTISREPQPPYIVKIHSGYHGHPERTAIEVKPRFEEIAHWRIAIPASASVVDWGVGTSDGKGSVSKNLQVVVGEDVIEGVLSRVFGSGDRLSPNVSAYVVVRGHLPGRFFFAPASGMLDSPSQWMGFPTGGG